MTEQEVGFKGKKKMSYGFKTSGENIFNLKKGIITTDDVIEGKKGPLDIKKYDTALMEIIFAFCHATCPLSYRIRPFFFWRFLSTAHPSAHNALVSVFSTGGCLSVRLHEHQPQKWVDRRASRSTPTPCGDYMDPRSD